MQPHSTPGADCYILEKGGLHTINFQFFSPVSLRGLGIWVWLSGSFFCVTLCLRFILCLQNGDRHHLHLTWMYKDALKAARSSRGRGKPSGFIVCSSNIFLSYALELLGLHIECLKVGGGVWIVSNYMQNVVWGQGFHHHPKRDQILNRAENHSSRQFLLLYLLLFVCFVYWGLLDLSSLDSDLPAVTA